MGDDSETSCGTNPSCLKDIDGVGRLVASMILVSSPGPSSRFGVRARLDNYLAGRGCASQAPIKKFWP